MNKYKIYSLSTIVLTLVFLFGIASVIYIVDPFFHYHKPNSSFSYTIDNERYQNDGILRNFDYDAIITGTSMTENFKTSEFDYYFDVKSVKVPFSGGSYKEVNDNLKRAITYNNIKYVLRGLDSDRFFVDKDDMQANVEYPEYLTDNNYFNDVKYLLNKTIFFRNVVPILYSYNKDSGTITSFDEAYNWQKDYPFGKDAVMKYRSKMEKVDTPVIVTEQDIVNLQENIEYNVVSIVRDNPEIKFYYFFTPYSVTYWYTYIQENSIDKYLYGEKAMIESLLEYDNVYLFSFNDVFELTTNLDNYKDKGHYSEYINSLMLKWMANGEHRLTKDNYLKYLDKIEKFYKEYDYDALFE